VRVVEDLSVDGVVAQEDVVVVAHVDEHETQCQEEQVARHVKQHVVEGALAQVDLVRCHDELPAGRLVVRVTPDVVHDQPAQDVRRVQLYSHKHLYRPTRTSSCGKNVADQPVVSLTDMELGHWVTGSMGHLGHLSRTGHWVIILTRCETRVFPVFEKPNIKIYIFVKIHPTVIEILTFY